VATYAARIAVLGVTFRPNTDDMREAPSLVIIPMLQARGARIRACDPQGHPKGGGLLPGVERCASALDAVDGCRFACGIAEWNEFRALDLRRVRELMRGNVLVDLRNMYPGAQAEEAGFVYFGVGRPAGPPRPGSDAKSHSLVAEICS
jgi:UDPglucose 6-dehydrogenase